MYKHAKHFLMISHMKGIWSAYPELRGFLFAFKYQFINWILMLLSEATDLNKKKIALIQRKELAWLISLD